jgi:hypothetical protein
MVTSLHLQRHFRVCSFLPCCMDHQSNPPSDDICDNNWWWVQILKCFCSVGFSVVMLIYLNVSGPYIPFHTLFAVSNILTSTEVRKFPVPTSSVKWRSGSNSGLSQTVGTFAINITILPSCIAYRFGQTTCGLLSLHLYLSKSYKMKLLKKYLAFCFFLVLLKRAMAHFCSQAFEWIRLSTFCLLTCGF